MEKKSFVLTGYVQRGTCNCGCITHNTFWQDGGFGGSSHLASLHQGIEKHLDKLSKAGPGESGKSHDVKVTITIESLGEHDHRILRRNSFSGLGSRDNEELREKILEPAIPENEVELKGSEEFRRDGKRFTHEVPVDYIQDIHDRILLIQRTGDMAKLEDLRVGLQESINAWE
jgi:hypothetical protein